MTTTFPAPQPSSQRSLAGCFVNLPVDAFLMGGLSIAVFALFRFVPASATSPWVATIGLWLVWTVSYPHFAATSARLYGSVPSMRQYPFTAVLTPLLFLGVSIASFASPLVVAPAFVKLFQLWSPYHFSGQTLGLTLLYARRYGVSIDLVMRRALTAFIYLTFIYSSARSEAAPGDGRFFDVSYPSLGLPAWLPRILGIAVWASAIALVAILVHRRDRFRLPWIVLLPAVTQCVWFTTAPIPAYRNLSFFFHSLQYLFIGWNLRLSSERRRTGQSGSPEFVVRTTSKWMAINIAGAFVMFWLMPLVGSRFGQTLGFSTAIVLVAFQTHHFFVDGVIWRLRQPGLAADLASSFHESVGHGPVPAGITP
jgi:hypothetical protein